MDWNSEIKEDGQDFSPVPAGEYQFRITNLTRGVSEGEKTKGSPQAKLELEIDTGTRKVKVLDTITLHTSSEWRISQFFRAIGLKKHGQPFRMDWNMVPGARGRCRVKVEPYIAKKGANAGKEMMSNKIDAYLDPAPVSAATSQPSDDGLL